MNLNTSIIIVTYNCETFITKFFKELLFSLRDHNSYEILVLDNSSKDRTVELIHELNSDKLNVYESHENVGFSKANNMLIKKATYDNILLLNPDVFGFNSNIWNEIFILWDHQNPMFIKLLNEDGSFQDCVGDVCGPKRIIHRFIKNVNYAIINEPVVVEMGIMAFMITPKQSFDKVGLLSEDYHMYSEDMDWCYRASQKSYKIIYEPRIQLTHIGGASAKVTSSLKKTTLIKYNSQKKFIKTHFTGIKKMLSLLSTNIMIMRVYLLFNKA